MIPKENPMLWHSGCNFDELSNSYICPTDGRKYFWHALQKFHVHPDGSNMKNESANEYFTEIAKADNQAEKLLHEKSVAGSKLVNSSLGCHLVNSQNVIKF